MGLNITRSEYGGWGADVSTDNYGPGNLSGGLSYTQRDGFTVSLNVNGTNAFNYNSQSGLSGNTDFMSQYAMNNGLAQGVAEESDTSEPNSAQQHNNAEQGAAAIASAGVELENRKRENGGDDNHYYDKDGNMRIRVTDSNGDSYYRAATAEEAHRIQNNNGYTMASETGGSRQLSADDVAEFKADWKKESPAQTDASIAALKSAGYDTSGLEKFVQDYRNGKAANNQSSTPATTTTQTTYQSQGAGLYGGVVQNILNSVTSGASNLWDKMTGGGSSNSPIELVFKPKSSGYTDANGNYYEQFGGKVQIVDINSDANPTYWNDKKFNQHHGGENYKADISAKGGSYGPAVPFKVLKAGLEEGFGGVVVVAPNGDESKGIKIGHFTRINSTIYNAVKSGTLLPAGTPLGFADSKIGYSSGPHFHIVKDKKAGNSNNEQNLKWLQGE